jgi:hypothetical protein
MYSFNWATASKILLGFQKLPNSQKMTNLVTLVEEVRV